MAVVNRSHMIIAMSRIGVVPLLGVALLGCALSIMAAQEVVLTIRGEGAQFEEAVRGCAEELGDQFTMSSFVVRTSTTPDDVRTQVETVKPVAVVLMDNFAIDIFRRYQSTRPDSGVALPAVALMAVSVERAIAGLRNTCGIAYEIPIVTSAVALRSLTSSPLRTIGVLHREFMTDFVRTNREYCARESIAVVPYVVPDKMQDPVREIRKGLRALSKNGTVDVVWIPNDNVLLRPELLAEAWMPELARIRRPVIVGVEVLANPQLDFGTFAVLPDHAPLGVQAAGLVLEAREDAWRFARPRVVQPLSVHKVLNIRQANKVLKIDRKKLTEIDKVLE